MRDEIISFEKSMNSVVMGFLGAVAGMALLAMYQLKIGATPPQSPAPGASEALSPQMVQAIGLWISQAVFLLGVYFLMQLASIMVQAAYVAWIEEKINGLASDRLTNWESIASRRVLWKFPGLFMAPSAILMVFILVLDGWSVYATGSVLGWSLGAVEWVVLVAMLQWILRQDPEKIQKQMANLIADAAA